MIKNINNILKIGSCLLVFLLPIFYFHNTFFPYTSTKTFLFYGIVEILTAFWFYALAIDSSYRLNKKTLFYFLPLLCFIIWITIAGILAVSPSLAFWSSIGRGTGLLTLYHCLAFALIIASLIKRNGVNYLYKFMQWFVNGCFVLAISVWCGNEGFSLFGFLKDSNGGGFMGNSSLTAAYLMFALAFGFFLFTSKTLSKQNKWWLGIKLGIILFSPLFINIYGFFTGASLLGSARGATIGIFVSLTVIGVWYLLISQKRNVRILGVIFSILGIIIFCAGWLQLVNPNTRLHQDFVKAASGTRFVFADTSKKAMAEHPWFGYGPENYMIAFQQNLNPKMALSKYNYEVWADRAHNIYYDMGVSGGYPSIMFYALFVFSLLYGLYRMRKINLFNHLQMSILAGLIIGYVFQNLFVFDSLLSLMAFFVLAGIIFTVEDFTVKEKNLSKTLNSSIKNVLGIVLSIACLASLIFFVFIPGKKVMDYYTVANAPVDFRAAHYGDLLGGSTIGESWDVSGIAYHIYQLYNADPIKMKNDKSFLPYAEKDLSNLIKYSETIAEKNKFDDRLYISIASLYNTLNYYSDNPYDPALGNHILSVLNQAKSISPLNPETYWIMAQTYIWEGDYNGVVDTYKKAVAVDPSIPDSHQLLLNFARGTGNQKLYNDSLLEAQKDVPDIVFH